MWWVLALIACGIAAGVAAWWRAPVLVPLRAVEDERTRHCPRCGETIAASARMCRFCEQMLIPGLD